MFIKVKKIQSPPIIKPHNPKLSNNMQAVSKKKPSLTHSDPEAANKLPPDASFRKTCAVTSAHLLPQTPMLTQFSSVH